MNEPEDQAARVRAAIFAGKKIEAIKLYREQTGLGLKEAKDAVERLETELRGTSPEQFTAPPARGCAAMLAVLVIIAGILALT